ncbi:MULTISPECIES: hypothetical protein [Bacillus cereus group]|uniref:hypothetical protein n=1 Tax=Bacillus cereus group TaxID=86661 RepID=UPI000864610D|nr:MULTISPECIES: hypothetical protein [Bacillus cereus group]AWC28273.1 hypothetical protein CG483_007750 [Bacillus cytotoxicus]AWC40342.1 hypothetical protein CG480_007500 [Bacillus cytotoxicus]AWC48273.1 hypothetical protein CG478_007500 [Bacillus cytotoxicus]AWC52340.1 hypothetical protein CG477_007710 [Bacillus cytotoxicus]AWC56474.1 hypothetical protein CG476_007740 [Bacillus cytotoxicus]
MKIKIAKSIESLQAKTFEMMTNSVSLKSILRGAGVTFVIIFGSAWAKQSTFFSLNSLMIIFGFFLIFMPYIFNDAGKTGI